MPRQESARQKEPTPCGRPREDDVTGSAYRPSRGDVRTGDPGFEARTGDTHDSMPARTSRDIRRPRRTLGCPRSIDIPQTSAFASVEKWMSRSDTDLIPAVEIRVQ
jgi:hypothetical protein